MRYTNVSERASLDGRYDVVICGASFAGLAVARELTGSGAAVLVLDRYAIGERPTSACGIPTDWLRELGLIELELQRFGELVVHTPGDTTVLDLPYTFSTFNYDEMCRLLWRGCDADFEIATVTGRGSEEDGEIAVETDRGTGPRPAGGRRARLAAHPGRGRRLPASRGGADPGPGGPPPGGQRRPRGLGRPPLRARRATAGPSRPAGSCGSASARTSRAPTSAREPTCSPPTAAASGCATRATGSRTELRPPVEGNVFFAGDSAGQCLPLTAEGIRTALYFGVGLGRELRSVVEGDSSREQAFAAYAALHGSHTRGFRILLAVQRLIPRIPPRLLGPAFRIYKNQRLINLTFNAYLRHRPARVRHPAEGRGTADDRDGVRELSTARPG